MGSNDWSSLAKRAAAALPGEDPDLITGIEELEREVRALRRMAHEVVRTAQTATNGGHPWTLERWLRLIGVGSLILTGVISWTWLLSNKWRDITSSIAAVTKQVEAMNGKVDAVKGQADRLELAVWMVEDKVDRHDQATAPAPRRSSPSRNPPTFPRDSQFAPSRGGGS